MQPSRPRGKGILLILRIASVAAALLFAALLATTILMAMPGNLDFIPPSEEGDFRFVDGVVYMDTSVTIGNNGYHDITNFTFSVEALVEDVVALTDYRTAPVDIPVGQRQEIPISIPLDLVPLQSSGYLIFLPANVSFTMGLSGTTTRSLLDFGVSFTFSQQFDALISALDVDLGNSTFRNETGQWFWDVPYVVGMAPFLNGNATALFTITNETGEVVSEASETIPLGDTYEGNLTLSVDESQALDLLARSQDLTVQVTLELPGGITVTYETVVSWEPGGG